MILFGQFRELAYRNNDMGDYLEPKQYDCYRGVLTQSMEVVGYVKRFYGT